MKVNYYYLNREKRRAYQREYARKHYPPSRKHNYPKEVNYEVANMRRAEKGLPPMGNNPSRYGFTGIKVAPPPKTYRDYLLASDYSQGRKDFYLKHSYQASL